MPETNVEVIRRPFERYDDSDVVYEEMPALGRASVQERSEAPGIKE
jgi:hypothetical protein